MEQKEINIAALLKDCPKGTKLYSTAYGEVTFNGFDSQNHIEVLDAANCHWGFFDNGSICNHGECLLFPSKEVMDWNLFNVKFVKMTGSAELDNKLKELLEIYHPVLMQKEYPSDTILYRGRIDNEVYASQKNDNEYNYILSTGTELTLEEEQPKFKVGDVVIDTNGTHLCLTNEAMYEDFIDREINSPGLAWRLATPEEIAKWNEEVLQPSHLHYSKSKRRIIDWFLPFDKCLMRDKGEIWIATLFSHFSKSEEDGNAYVNIAQGYYDECLPYNEKTANLIGTTDDWEE